MKTLKISMIALLGLALTLSTSCKKETVEPTPATPVVDPGKGSVSIVLSHKWGMMNEQNFVLGSDLIHPMHKDTLNFSKLKYYVSNVKFKKADGTYFVHPESYFLVDLADLATTTLAIANVPAADYTEMSYTLGVDSTRNCSGAQTGALDPVNTMFWSWNSGYIATKAEGTYLKNKVVTPFTFHLGGFKTPNNVTTTKTISFSSNNLTVTKDKASKVKITVNPGTLFHTTSVKTLDMIHMPGSAAVSMAVGFYTHSYGFMFDSIEE